MCEQVDGKVASFYLRKSVKSEKELKSAKPPHTGISRLSRPKKRPTLPQPWKYCIWIKEGRILIEKYKFNIVQFGVFWISHQAVVEKAWKY